MSWGLLLWGAGPPWEGDPCLGPDLKPQRAVGLVRRERARSQGLRPPPQPPQGTPKYTPLSQWL